MTTSLQSEGRTAAWFQARYEQSERFLERALKTIPLGSQTFSKSITQYPRGVSPYFIQRASGSRVWDVDGNEYLDFINSLAAVTLGYQDPDVTTAVEAQLKDGVIFSLPHPVEMAVSEAIVEMVPCADMVRFGKNGSDATSGCIRLARAFTGRDHVAVCGYHGWHDWYIASTTRDKGVPEAVKRLTHQFNYNDLESLHSIFREYPGEVAAVILEPMNVVFPEAGFLESVRELAHQHGSLLIFDETVTGFRLAPGGAQEYFGVTPDLASFGKGLANGYPLAAVTGRGDVMRQMEEIFFSFTFGGETLSLAAALATVNKLRREPVIETISDRGNLLKDGLEKRIQQYGLEETLTVSGHPTWSFLLMNYSMPESPLALKTLFLQEVFARGILTLGSHNLSYAHSSQDVETLLSVYDEVLPVLKEAIETGSILDRLHCPPLTPLFKIR